MDARCETFATVKPMRSLSRYERLYVRPARPSTASSLAPSRISESFFLPDRSGIARSVHSNLPSGFASSEKSASSSSPS